MRKLFRHLRLSVIRMLRVITGNKILALLLVGSSLILVAGALFSLPLWDCPFYQITGHPCPGCGMTRSFGELFHARFGESLKLHAFTLYFLILGIVVFIAAVLPRAKQKKFSRSICQLEKKFPIHTLILSAFVLYGAGRLLLSLWEGN